MIRIFISYRRDDTLPTTGRIFDRLESRYGRESVFMDVDAIPFGVDFRVHLAEQVSHCSILLAIIGHRWFGLNSNGDRRIDNQGDFVRIEVESALSRGIPVIPVLVDGCAFPSTDDLPPSLKDLSFRNGIAVDNGRDFNIHVDRLIRGIDFIGSQPGTDRETTRSRSEVPALRQTSTLCLECGKAASFHIYDVTSRSVDSTAHLCEACASQRLRPVGK